MTAANVGRNPSFLAFFRSASLKDKRIQFEAYFFAPFLVIFERCATLLMGIQWREHSGAARTGGA
jgi:hypothetical protein